MDHTGLIGSSVGLSSWTDQTVPAPQHVSLKHTEEEIEFAVKERGWPGEANINNLYLVLPAPGSHYEESYVTEVACGVHGWESAYHTPYAIVPWPGDEPFVAGWCTRIDRFNGERDWAAESAIASHEYIEATTDPEVPTGWYGSGGEIADICAYQDYVETWGWVEAMWDNHLSECVLTDPNPPTFYAESDGSTGVENHGPEATGVVNPGGDDTSYNVEWGETTSYGSSTPIPSEHIGEGTEAVAVATPLDGLKGKHTYHYRVSATDAEGYKVWGGDKILTTPDWSPTVSVEAATESGLHKYMLHGKIDPRGVGTHYRYEWGPSESYGHVFEPTGEMTGTSELAVSHEIEELEEESTYDCRIVAESAEGANEAKGSFTTPAWRPTVTLEAPAEIVETEATLHGTVNPHGRATEYWFEYGPTESYGAKAPAPNGSAGSGTAAKGVEAIISSLKGETTYHFRLVAQNEAGPPRYGKGETFITTRGEPLVTTEGSSVIESLEPTEEAKLKGAVDPDANETEYFFEYGLTELFGSKVPAVQGKIEPGKKWVSVEATATGLKHKATYYYRLVGENVKGTTQGTVHTLSTKSVTGPEWVMQSPVNYEGNSKLLGVSCASSSECMSVGEYKSGSLGLYQSLAERWNGSEWLYKPTLSEKTTVGLSGTSCSSSTSCEAVGRYLNSSGYNVTLAEKWTGSEWKLQSTPNPGGGGALTGISCTSASECTAVGFYMYSVSETKTLAMRWNGTSWETQTTPNGAGSKLTELTGVSCTNFFVLGVMKKECIASGYAKNLLGAYEAIAERWNGSEWTLKTLPKPEEAQKASYLLGVSCATSSECEGVGYYEDSSKVDVALTEKWSGYYGTTWSVQSAPIREGAKLTKLNGVSCVAKEALECETVGEFITSTEKRRTLGAGYAGSHWTVQYSPNGEEGEERPSYLDGVSCTATTTCTAVGYSEKSGSIFFPLAQRLE